LRSKNRSNFFFGYSYSRRLLELVVGIWHLTKKFQFNLDTSKKHHQTLFFYCDTGYLPCGFANIRWHSHHTLFEVFRLAGIVHFGLLSPPRTSRHSNHTTIWRSFFFALSSTAGYLLSGLR